ncbi:MAG: DUF1127 domain-containing protein [Alphaproteobacteria bacterium]
MSANIVTFPAVSGAVGRLLGRLVVKPLANWRARQMAFEELMALDDHMLADIGISRGQIPGIIDGQAAPRRAVNENKPSAAA